MKVVKTKIHGLEVYQVIKAGKVICQRYSLEGVRTWLLSQKN